MILLAIESSCDETAAAVVRDGIFVRSSVVASQIEEHKLYGGVVPEIASRRHCESMVSVVEEAMEKADISFEKLDGIAVTYAPGLIGALLVGVNYAKGLSAALNIPLIPVHHIKGHIAANYIEFPNLKPPFLCLVASGGHSHIIEVKDYTKFNTVGRTVDDAAGEAFDKVARALGFQYPGGIYIDQAAKNGDRSKYKLPYPKAQGIYDFSFSGLKTAVLNIINKANQKNEEIDKNSLAASFQYTICDILSTKVIEAALDLRYKTVVLAGGVAANSCLRQMLKTRCDENKITSFIAPIKLCGDNAAMIGCQGYFEYLAGNVANDDLNAVASLKL